MVVVAGFIWREGVLGSPQRYRLIYHFYICPVRRGWRLVWLSLWCVFDLGQRRLYKVVVAVGECITEASIRGLPVLRDPSVYIHSV